MRPIALERYCPDACREERLSVMAGPVRSAGTEVHVLERVLDPEVEAIVRALARAAVSRERAARMKSGLSCSPAASDQPPTKGDDDAHADLRKV